MKRDYKSINKMINKKLKEQSAISQEIVMQFKKLYYYKKMTSDDHKINNFESIEAFEMNANPFDLTYEPHKKILEANIKAFKGENPGVINARLELLPFLRSCGNILNKQEIEFLFFVIGPREKIAVNDLYKICGCILHFREKKNVEILNDVFDSYYDEHNELYKDKKRMELKNVELFLEQNNEYFNSKDHKKYILEQCKYLGDTFSLDALISMIITPSQFCPF